MTQYKNKEMLDSKELLNLTYEKLSELEHALNTNIPKSAILVVVRNLKRTIEEQRDYTWRGF